MAAGLKPGDRIGIWSPNHVEWIETQFAAAKAGLILVRDYKFQVIVLFILLTKALLVLSKRCTLIL